MKKQITKKCGAIIACSALMAATLAGGVVGVSGITAKAVEGDTPATPKVLYYVDAGNMATDEAGTTEYQGRNGDGKYPAKYETAFMQADGLSFDKEVDGAYASGCLYNSSLDNEYGVDPATGKSWGIVDPNSAASWKWWGVGHTDSGNSYLDGFKTTRYTKEKPNEEGVLTYKFEVDNATTALKVIVGTRTIATWGPAEEGSIKINGGENQTLGAKNEDQIYEYSTDVKGVADGDKYFVTLAFADNNKCTQISWIVVATADYQLYEMPTFVEPNATTVTLTASDNSTVQGTLTDASKEAIAAANYLDKVSVTATVGTRSIIGSVAVIPNAATRKYFVNLGDTTDAANTYGGIMLKDGAYSAEAGYGWTEGTANSGKEFPGNSGYVDQPYDYSCRIDITSAKYKFDQLHAGTYGVVVGAVEYWAQWDPSRPYEIQANDGTKVSFTGPATNLATAKGACEGTVGEDGSLTVDIKCVGKECVISYILVYEKELSTEIHNVGDCSNIEWIWTGTESAVAKTPCVCGVADTYVNYNATITSAETTAPGCETEGVTTYTATVKTYTDTKTAPIAATGHTTVAHEAVAASCSQAGNSAYWSCENCDKLFSNAEGTTEIDAIPVIAKLPHTMTHHEANNPTIDTEGNEEYWECTVCHDLFSDANGETKIDDIPVIPAQHTPIHHEAVAATCITGGNEEYWECEFCHKLFSNEACTTEITEIPATDALGHDYDYEHIVWNWDGYACTTATVACKNNAAHTDTLTVEVTNAVTTQPTTTADGVKTYTAKVTVGDKSYTDTKTEKLDKLTETPGDEPGDEPGKEPGKDEPKEKDGLSMGAIAGIVIPLAAVVGAGAGVGVFFLKRKLKK